MMKIDEIFERRIDRSLKVLSRQMTMAPFEEMTVRNNQRDKQRLLSFDYYNDYR